MSKKKIISKTPKECPTVCPTVCETDESRVTPLEWGLLILLVVVGTAAVFFSVDPARRLNEATNAQRFSDITAIIDDVVDDQHRSGTFIESIETALPETAYEIGLCDSGASCEAVAVQEACLDLSELGPTPMDPESGSDLATDYYFIRHENGEVTVGACSPNPEGVAGDGPIPAINLRD